METREGQKYVVLRDFKDSGAQLKKNETIIITGIDKSSIYVNVIDTTKSWVLNEKPILANCSLLLPESVRPAPKEIKKEKVKIKRHNKEEFKTMLENLK